MTMWAIPLPCPAAWKRRPPQFAAPAAIAAVVAWLARNEPPVEWHPDEILRGPAIAKQLELLRAPSLLES